jgi:phosphoribosylglycinamide formyltransferase 1
MSGVRRFAVLASGGGTVLQSILDAGLPVSVVLVDRECQAVERAERAGVPAVVVGRTFGRDFDRTAHTHRVVDALEPHAVDLIAMAGFGTILDKPIHDRYPSRIVNTHPSLLPAFPGWHAVREALEHGVKVTGCTIHLAGVEVDTGPILAQEAVPVLPGDDEATLHERIKAVEHRLYPEVLWKLLEGTLP